MVDDREVMQYFDATVAAASQTYHVFVHTGDKRGAGTDANVFITMFGQHDDTGMSINQLIPGIGVAVKLCLHVMYVHVRDIRVMTAGTSFCFTGLLPLKASKTHRDKFERNQCDEFVIEAVDLGELRKIK